MKSWLRKALMSMSMGLCLVALARPASAQYGQRRLEGEPSYNVLPPALEDIGIEDKAGSSLPRDVKLTHSDGSSFVVGEYMDGEKPLIVVLAYYKCPMLCSLVLNGLSGAIKGLGKTAGKDYRVLVVSFDSRDTTEIAHEKRANYVQVYGRDVDPAGYEYATGDAAEVKRLADAVGFRYRWEEKTQQFAHAAGLFIVTPSGKLSQALTGVQFKSDEVDHALDEAGKEVWHSPLKSALLYCFTYDPKKGSYVPIVRNVMKVGGAITIAGIALFLANMFRRDRARLAGSASEPVVDPETTPSLQSTPPNSPPTAAAIEAAQPTPPEGQSFPERAALPERAPS